MRAFTFLLVALTLAGCANDAAFDGVNFQHDFTSGEPRVRTFDLPAGVDRIEVALGITGIVDPLRCDIRAPARLSVVDPTGRETTRVEATGAPIATGGNECTVVNAERAFSARPGTWTVLFEGEGDVRATVGVRALE